MFWHVVDFGFDRPEWLVSEKRLQARIHARERAGSVACSVRVTIANLSPSDYSGQSLIGTVTSTTVAPLASLYTNSTVAPFSRAHRNVSPLHTSCVVLRVISFLKPTRSADGRPR